LSTRDIATGVTVVPIARRASDYPLQRRFAVYGVACGLLGGALFGSPLAGFSFLVLFVAVGALWRRDEIPILPFSIAFQWIAVSGGYLFLQVTGRYPQYQSVGNLDLAVLLYLLGLLVLVGGIRVAFHFERLLKVGASLVREEATSSHYSIHKLFFIVLIIFAVDWLYPLNPVAISYNGAQIIGAVLQFRYVFLGLLLLTAIRRRKGYHLAAVGLLYVLGPNLTSTFSHFKEFLILVLLILLAEWRPWASGQKAHGKSRLLVIAGAALGLVLLPLAIIWVGVAKPLYRPAVLSGQVQGSQVSQVRAFTSIVSGGVGDLNWGQSFETLAARTSGGTAYFSHVVERVPHLYPFENGKLTQRAVSLTVRPRILFPGKDTSTSDSYLVTQYAGVEVAGSEEGVSVGLSYMAETYIDYGAPIMFVPIFLIGALVGFASVALRAAAPSHRLFVIAATILFLFQFIGHETALVKVLGGVLLTCIVFTVIFLLSGRWLHAFLLDGQHPRHTALRQ